VDRGVVREAGRQGHRRRAPGDATAGQGEELREEGPADGGRVQGDRRAGAAESCGLAKLVDWRGDEQALEGDDAAPVRPWLLVRNGDQEIRAVSRSSLCPQAAKRRAREGHQ